MSVEVSLKHLPVVNFSLQQNHVPVVREILLRNTGEQDVESLDIEVTFDPEFAQSTTLHVDHIAAGASAQLVDVPIHISTSYLSNLTERISGHINVEVRSGEEVLATKTEEITALAFDQWSGLAVLPAMLASFVTPNHPDVAPIIKRAADILGAWTGSPAMDEYQTKDPNRVKLQMAAIYEAIAEKAIAYCTIPASFEDYGQRIRLYSDVLGTKLGTCLDMTLLYAGCLEAVGIHPLLVIIQGHAFAGGWLVDESFPDSVNDDVSLLTKRTAEGINEILLVETTCMNAGTGASFDQAVDSANQKLVDTDKFVLFVDVKRARNAQIRPLPLRVVRDGSFVIEEEKPVERNSDAPSELSATTTVNEVDHIAVGKQTIWERKLLDLSLRNNLLNTRITKNTLQLISANVNLLEDALAAGEEFQVLPKPNDWDNPLMSEGIYQALNASSPVADLVKSELSQHRLYSYLDEAQLQRALTFLYRSSRLSLEENGANTLYLAIGLLKWYETPASTRPRFAPIILVPIEIIRRSASKGYIIRSRDEDTVLNITLLELLRQDFGITIGGLDPLPTDESGVDVTQIFNVVRRAIMSQSGWDVQEQAILGNFSFNKFIMWNDIHNNAEKLSRNKIVASLISGKMELDIEEEPEQTPDLDETFPAGSVALPIAADSSQFSAIIEAVAAKSFILHGPPGTGKSQTITNIIANALYNGKKVLFVAEKMAALQVVQRRLESIGLAPFCLELHSNKTKKSYILEQLKRTTEVLREKSNEDFSIRAGQINLLRRDLNSYVHKLHRTYPAGLSLYDCIAAYTGSTFAGTAYSFPFDAVKNLSPTERAELENKVGQFQAICLAYGNPAEHPLDGINLTVYNPTVKSEVLKQLPELLADIHEFIQAADRFLALFKYKPESMGTDELKATVKIAQTLLNSSVLPAGVVNAAVDDAFVEKINRLVEEGTKRDKAHSALTDEFTTAILNWNFEFWQKRWEESSRKWWLFRILGQRKVRAQFKQFSKGKTDFTNEEIPAYFHALEAFKNDSKEIEKMGKKLGTVLGPLWNNGNAEWDVIAKATADAAELNRSILELTKDVPKAAQLRRAINKNLQDGVGAFNTVNGELMDSVIALGKNVHEQTDIVARLLDAPSFEQMPVRERKEVAQRWLDNLDLLHDRVAFNSLCDALTADGFGDFVAAVRQGSVPCDSVAAFFDKSFYRTYAEFILTKEPELNAFHATLFEDKIARFKQFSSEFERLTREELYAQLAASLPALQKEAAQGSEVGILQRNIRNGGRGTSIRRLFDQIPDLLTRMCPCMLMSPISVAQYIDAGRAPFDLVIFDEASQMPTSEAVGAIARGKNVVVVGDPKQMPPTNFFSTNTFDEDNADKEDMENILEDCLALSMPSKYLLWHYRSKHESLITFSNVKYYDNKLLTFPSPDDLSTKVGWVNVEGVYDRGRSRQNRAEAEAVIKEIERRLDDPELAKRSIGVVTFNTNQQSLIEDMLNDLFSRRPDLEAKSLELEDPIFVKNLENVQGDERDVILFSIGYGPDKDGKIALNFGPLNRDGGRRRLNVAVSRARYEMMVFSTLRADQIDLNRTSADGVADLKAFLEYAEKGREYFTNTNTTSRVAGDRLVEAIAARLADRGYIVKTNIGSSGYKIDIGVVDSRDPDKYIIGIICDGDRYASSPMANDRIITQDSVLNLLGWSIHHVWAMDWWENPDKTFSTIISAVEKARDGIAKDARPRPVRITMPPAPPKDAPKPPSPKAPVVEQVDPKAPYISADLEQELLTSEDFASGYFDHKILPKIQKVIAAEAPISKSLLSKKIISSFSISRTGPRLAHHLDDLFRQAGLRRTGDKFIFFWNPGQDPHAYSAYRPDSGRDAVDIPPQEFAVAMRKIVEEQGALPVDALKKATANLFGFNRMTETLNGAISRALDYAVDKGRLILADDRVKLP